MKNLFLIVLFSLWTIPSCFAQLKTYSFEEVERLSKEKPKPFMIFIHTSWCKYCSIMENTTFKNPEIITLLNNDFYFISLDAESKNNITFHNHVFKFKPSGQNKGIHELATELATIDSEIIYPTITILDPNYLILFQKHSFMDTKTLLAILKKTSDSH